MGGEVDTSSRVNAGTLEGQSGKEETLALINEEILSLYEFLEEKGATESEWAAVTEPLVVVVERALRRRVFLRRLRRVVTSMVALAVVLTTLYVLMQVAWVQKMVSVAFRRLLIFILPWWDWTRVYHSDCFLSNPYYVSRALVEDDCNVCESLERIDRLSNASSRVVAENYLRNDLPFMVTDGMDDWPVMNTEDFWFDNITEMYLDDEQRGVYPCELASNLRMRSDDLRTFLLKIHNPEVMHWWGHWENCNKKGAKALRQIYRRPYFLPPMVDLSDSNWVIISSDFKGKVYKELDFQTELLVVAQVRGWSRLRLVPREPCDHYCPELVDTLTEGNMVVVTNLLWKFEYIPGENTDNLAIAIGGFWT